MLKKLLGAVLSGAAFMVGVAGVLATIIGIQAATLPFGTGPGGTNPVQNPTLLGDYNTLVSLINANAAWAATSTPPSTVLGTNSMSLGGNQLGNGSPSVPILQTISAVWTTTTTTNCATPGAYACMGIIDNLGTLRWLTGR